MENSVSVQTLEFLWSALLGVGLGVLFDITRVVRSHTSENKGVTALFDSLFWCAAIISLLAFVLTVCEGKMRWYILFGVFSGGFVYMSAVSSIVYKVIMSLIAALSKLLSLITRPLYLLLRYVWRKIKKTERKAEKKIKKSIKENIAKKRTKKRKVGKNVGEEKKKTQKSVS